MRSHFLRRFVNSIIQRWMQLAVLSGLVTALLYSPATALAQNPSLGGVVGLDHLLTAMTIWLGICAIIVTIIISVAAFYVWHQYRRANDLGKEMKDDLIRKMDKEIQELMERYNLRSLKPPDAILEEARKEYEPRIEQVRSLVKTSFDLFEEKEDAALGAQALEKKLLTKVSKGLMAMKCFTAEEKEFLKSIFETP